MLRKIIFGILWLFWAGFMVVTFMTIFQLYDNWGWGYLAMPTLLAFDIAPAIILPLDHFAKRRAEARIKGMSWNEQQRLTRKNRRFILWGLAGFIAVDVIFWLLSEFESLKY